MKMKVYVQDFFTEAAIHAVFNYHIDSGKERWEMEEGEGMSEAITLTAC